VKYLMINAQAARRSHAAIVDILVTAGANLGGSDLEGGYVDLEVKKALTRGAEHSLEIWRKAGANVSE
jgi:lysophospholipase